MYPKVNMDAWHAMYVRRFFFFSKAVYVGKVRHGIDTTVNMLLYLIPYNQKLHQVKITLFRNISSTGYWLSSFSIVIMVQVPKLGRIIFFFEQKDVNHRITIDDCTCYALRKGCKRLFACRATGCLIVQTRKFYPNVAAGLKIV